jgi:hypothetical protein
VANRRRLIVGGSERKEEVVEISRCIERGLSEAISRLAIGRRVTEKCSPRWCVEREVGIPPFFLAKCKNWQRQWKMIVQSQWLLIQILK